MSPNPSAPAPLKLALPKGRMQAGVLELLADAGLPVHVDERSYRPRLHLPGIDAKLLKPQNIVEMLLAGSRDLGFAGADWVAELGPELGAEPIELLDTGLDPVRIVAPRPRRGTLHRSRRNAAARADPDGEHGALLRDSGPGRRRRGAFRAGLTRA